MSCSENGNSMPRVAIVTDSIACLPKVLVEQYGIVIVPIRLLFKGKVYVT
jgi:fatty acid-binding protein DegV